MTSFAPALWAVALTLAGSPAGPAVVGSWLLAAPGQTLDGLTLSPDGRYLALRVASDDHAAPDALAVIDLQTGQPGPRFSADAGRLSRPVWLPPHQLLSAGEDGLRVYSLDHALPPRRLALPLTPGPLAGSADGSRVACPEPSGGVLVLEARTGARLARLPFCGRLRELLFTDDGGLLLALTDDPASGAPTLTVWDPARGVQLAQRPTRAVACLGLPPGRGVVCLGGQAGVFEYRLPDLALLRRADCGDVRACCTAPSPPGLLVLQADGHLSELDSHGAVARQWPAAGMSELVYLAPGRLAAILGPRLEVYEIGR